MITAKEAKEKSMQSKQEILDSELKELEENILCLTITGKTELYLDKWVSNEAKEVLESLGYKVERNTLRNEDSVIINWGE